MNTQHIVGPLLNVSFGMIVIYGTYLTIKFINKVLDIKGDSKYESKE